MSAAQNRTISLSVEQADYVDRLVASGAYASDSEVLLAGIEALRDRDADIEHWLREEVVPAYDAVTADPNRLVPADQVLSSLRARRLQRLKDAAES